MDVFSRTFLPAAAEADVPLSTVNRHLPVFRQCVEADDAAVLVARCARADRMFNDHLLLLTHRRLVVIQQTPVLRRLRLHLNTDLRHLNNVNWNADPRLSTVELTATAIDGVRERFTVRADDSTELWHLDALLAYVFQPRPAAQRPARPQRREAVRVTAQVPQVAPA